MQRTKKNPTTPGYGWLRTFSLAVSFWLFLLPQLVLLGQDSIASSTCGAEPVLLEEEVKHGTDAEPAPVHVLRTTGATVGARPVNEALHRSHLGEVPHLPPWQ